MALEQRARAFCQGATGLPVTAEGVDRRLQ